MNERTEKRNTTVLLKIFCWTKQIKEKSSLEAERLGRKWFEGEITKILNDPTEMTPNRCSPLYLLTKISSV